jgi:hypothetical protein
MWNAQARIFERRSALVVLVFALFARPVQAQCVYSLSTTSVSVPSTANTGSFSVVTGSSCSWTAASNVSWVTISAGASGAGIGTVSYAVDANTTGAARSGTLTVAGQIVTIAQSVSSCTYSVSTTSVSVPSTANTGSFSVVTGSSCAWTAASNVSWAAITAGASGAGIGTVSYSILANAGAARGGTLTVAGQTVTINQAAGSQSQPPAQPKNLHVVRD